MDKVTKADIRSHFKYARILMTDANKMMKDKSITDFTNDSDFGQLANELGASVGMLQVWLDEQIQKGRK